MKLIEMNSSDSLLHLQEMQAEVDREMKSYLDKFLSFIMVSEREIIALIEKIVTSAECGRDENAAVLINHARDVRKASEEELDAAESNLVQNYLTTIGGMYVLNERGRRYLEQRAEREQHPEKV